MYYSLLMVPKYTRLHVRMKLEEHLIFKNSKIIYTKG